MFQQTVWDKREQSRTKTNVSESKKGYSDERIDIIENNTLILQNILIKEAEDKEVHESVTITLQNTNKNMRETCHCHIVTT